MTPQRYFIVGGAGFIGSHFVDALLDKKDVEAVTLYDNFSSGRTWHYQHRLSDSRLRVVSGEVADPGRLEEAMAGHQVVIHLASNPDIARAASEPAIDFSQGTALTHHVLEAMRKTGAAQILYASGSGVYGDIGDIEAHEDRGPLRPISTYGASKLAGEALISAYSAMFGMSGLVFRFGNVVGPRQTHGVGLDFMRRLLENPRTLRILGDGRQSKTYIHVFDVVRAVLRAHQQIRAGFETFNVATGDYITVREIADLAVKCLELPAQSVAYEFSGGDRGWRGDVPVVRLNTDRIRSLGWRCQRLSGEAILDSLRAILSELRGEKR